MLNGHAPITATVTGTVSVLVTAVQCAGDNKVCCRVVNAGTTDVELFDATLADGSCAFGKGVATVYAGWEAVLDKNKGNYPTNGLKAMSNTGSNTVNVIFY